MQPLKKAQKYILIKIKEVKGEVEVGVEDTHNPFEDSKEKLKIH